MHLPPHPALTCKASDTRDKVRRADLDLHLMPEKSMVRLPPHPALTFIASDARDEVRRVDLDSHLMPEKSTVRLPPHPPPSRLPSACTFCCRGCDQSCSSDQIISSTLQCSCSGLVCKHTGAMHLDEQLLDVQACIGTRVYNTFSAVNAFILADSRHFRDCAFACSSRICR